MVNCISVLGSTGSIGRQTLMAAEHLGIRVAAIAANRDIALLEQQARKFLPRLVSVYDRDRAEKLRSVLSDTDIRVMYGMRGLIEAARIDGADCVVTAVSGSVGLEPTLEAIKKGRRIALANKETLVCAGEIVMSLAVKRGAEIIPVDSEHSAIFQSLGGRLRSREIKRILLTGSGGPFRGMSREQTYNKTPREAVAHPRWNMGAKISVDSATMMNKGLELIEAMHLFKVEPDRIRVLIHPQSVLHSAVEFVDGSVVGQMGVPDMTMPIQYALTYPERRASQAAELDLLTGDLHFEDPDIENTPCLGLAMECASTGGTAPCVMSAANEEAVAAFLAGRIPFGRIYECVAETLESIDIIAGPGLEEIKAADAAAREFVRKRI